jgi:drug/metabolite transporter (DMT)-like permease
MIALERAVNSGVNPGIVISIANGSVLFGFAASLCIYNEKVTRMQIFGSFICIAGITVLFLAVNEYKGYCDTILIVYAFISLFCLGIRIILARFVSKVLGGLNFVKLSFTADCFLGFVLLLVI